jgi:hypothetical protein
MTNEGDYEAIEEMVLPSSCDDDSTGRSTLLIYE